MKRLLLVFSQAVLAAILFTSCASYKANIMFKVPEDATLQKQAEEVQRNYVIQKNDMLKLDVYTNKGELIIDPDFNLMKEIPVQNAQRRPDPNYLVDVNGVAKFPMLGELKVEGLTIRQTEEILQKEYARYYTDPFVVLQYINKRVIVLGAPGGQVIPLVNENVTLAEVLALASGIENNARATNIRVLRGDQYFVADFSTIAGYQKSNMIMQPGDIVYVEPIRRPVSEAFRDYGVIVSVLTSLTTLIVVLTSL
ncbi:MAG: polysaccharide biosynthesis/export family protein [Cyclobacteriaceae bacterium]|nr:polysaccharide biosynthesis/export family protein [Cyclobacteriaceae bacterium]